MPGKCEVYRKVERELNVIARIEAKSAMSYLLCSSLTGDISILRSDFSYLALVLEVGRKEAARLQGKAKSN